MKIVNKCDRSALAKDLNNFLESSYARNHTITIDNRLDAYGFDIPELRNLRHVSTDTCLGFLRGETCKHIVLTIGTSYFFPSIGECEWENRTTDKFPYPALKGVKGAHIAEIHCTTHNIRPFEAIEIETYYRITLYEIDGVCKTKRRIARFEKGKEINESFLGPGEDLDEVLHYSNFDSPGEYRDALAAEGWGFCGACCWGVSKAMGLYDGTYRLSFPEAMRKLYDNGSLIKVVYPDREKRRPTCERYGPKTRKR